jgi:hypothetical protein
MLVSLPSQHNQHTHTGLLATDTPPCHGILLSTDVHLRAAAQCIYHIPQGPQAQDLASFWQVADTAHIGWAGKVLHTVLAPAQAQP